MYDIYSLNNLRFKNLLLNKILTITLSIPYSHLSLTPFTLLACLLATPPLISTLCFFHSPAQAFEKPQSQNNKIILPEAKGRGKKEKKKIRNSKLNGPAKNQITREKKPVEKKFGGWGHRQCGRTPVCTYVY